MNSQRFTATVELGGRTATGFEVPPGVVEGLGAGRRPAVTVTVRGHRYRSTVATMGGRFLLPLAAEHRVATGLAAGDEVEVQVDLDSEPRVVEVPPDLAAALAAEPATATAWAALSYSHQRQHVLAVEGAKSEATRARRVAGVIGKLTGTS